MNVYYLKGMKFLYIRISTSFDIFVIYLVVKRAGNDAVVRIIGQSDLFLKSWIFVV